MLSGKQEHGKAVAELGRDAVEDLNCARRAVESDAQWGLKRA
jgi:hypothetical protein